MPVKRLSQRKQGNRKRLATKKPTRGFKAAPPRLSRIIELVNLVRPEDVLPPIDYNPPPVGEDPTAFMEEKAAELEAKTKGLPDRFLKYVFPKDKPGRLYHFISGDVQRYENVRVWRENLQAIARPGPRLVVKLDSALYIVRDNQTGTHSVVPDLFRAAIEEDGVNVDYIRACLVCHRIYYEDRLYHEGRITEPACQYHGQALRSRRNYRPVKTDLVEAYLAENPDSPRTVETIKDGIEATERQIRLALDYLERKKRAKTAPKR